MHYAGVVWVVNRWPLLWKPARKRRAPEPKPQGRSRKEKKGSPPHPTHHRSTTLVRSGGHLAAGRRALVSVAVLCKTRISAGLFFFSPPFFFLFILSWSNRMGCGARNTSQGIAELFKYFSGNGRRAIQVIFFFCGHHHHRCGRGRLPFGPVQQAGLSAAKMKRKKSPLRVLYKTRLPESISRSLFRR